MTNSWRFSTLADRHRALGSNLEDWSGMGTAWSYSKGDPDAEYMAIRTKAGLMDVSGLKKVHITGHAATHVIDRATTRDPEKVAPGKSVYACMLNDAGKFVDDCIITRSGYSGEDGFEISIPQDQADLVVRRLLDHPDCEPIGLVV
ncbi:MAG: aminomethyl transferase family protein, partial [Acetobacteraceae bacterium]